MCPVHDEDLAFDFTWNQAFSPSALDSLDAGIWTGQSPHDAVTAASSHQDRPAPALPSQPRPKLGFLPQSEWRSDGAFVTKPPGYLHYKTEVKITLNNRTKFTHTDQNIVLSPSAYWHSFLQPKVEGIVCTRWPHATLLDTSIKICINDRGEPNIPKQDPIPNWEEIEQQFIAWGELFRAGKRLSLTLSFNYKEEQATNLASSDKRSKGSTTRRMLAERAVQLDAEGDSGTHDPTWRAVYERMRCPRTGCGPHCFITPEGHRHIPLRPHHLLDLIKHVDNGGKLDSHKDVPERIQKQLLAEEQQSKKRKAKAIDDDSNDSRQPVNNNPLPGDSRHRPRSNDPLPTPTWALFELPECADTQLKGYVDWQINRHENIVHKEGFKTALEAANAECISLNEIDSEKDMQYFRDRNVPRGIAWELVHQIRYWFWEVKYRGAEQ